MDNKELIVEVKKEMEEENKSREREKVKAMLQMINNKKAELRRVKAELRKLEEALINEDYSALNASNITVCHPTDSGTSTVTPCPMPLLPDDNKSTGYIGWLETNTTY